MECASSVTRLKYESRSKTGNENVLYMLCRGVRAEESIIRQLIQISLPGAPTSRSERQYSKKIGLDNEGGSGLAFAEGS